MGRIIILSGNVCLCSFETLRNMPYNIVLEQTCKLVGYDPKSVLLEGFGDGDMIPVDTEVNLQLKFKTPDPPTIQVHWMGIEAPCTRFTDPERQNKHTMDVFGLDPTQWELKGKTIQKKIK